MLNKIILVIQDNLRSCELQVLNQTQDHRQRVLVGVSKELQNWTIMVKKMKAIYYTLNLFNVDVTKKCLIGEGWIPVEDVESVRNSLTEASVSKQHKWCDYLQLSNISS